MSETVNNATHGVSFLGGDLVETPAQNKIIALGSQSDGHLPAQKDKRKDIAIL